MGAALTYARRYALFTLVGIAGEDDLDAPDLDSTPQVHASAGQLWKPGRGDPRALHQPIFDPESSAVLRDRLVREITDLNSAEAGAEWAPRRFPPRTR